MFAGFGPAFTGIAIFTIVGAVWIMPEVGSLRVSHPVEVIGLTVYVVADCLVAWIGSAHRALIDESERQKTALRVAQADAEAANRAKDDFMAVLSHELRTPLTTIVAGVRLIRDICSREEKAQRARDAIERQAVHLSRLVDDLLDMKNIVAGRVVLQRQSRNLAEVVEACVATLDEAGQFKNHTLTFEAEPVQIDGDEVRLHQIVANLVGNAVKYTPAGGLIQVSVKRENDNAVLRVQDTGFGMSPEMLSRVFEMFVQGPPGPERTRSGLGIGLSVVRRLVELHNGTVEASSDGPGRGSTFTVRLPCSHRDNA